MSETFDSGDEFTDFILRITHQIWEEREVKAINTFYSRDVIVRSPSGVTTKCQSVVDSTLATLKEFPDRQLLGEDVIHNGNGNSEWLSSHRIFSTATHLGSGYFGEPTGRRLKYRVIADCAVRDGVIFDEWLVRDFGAIVRQMGSTPEAIAQKIVRGEGGTTLENDRKFTAVLPVYTGKGNSTHAGSALANTVIDLLKGDMDTARRQFDRAAQFDLPGGVVVNGRDAGLAALREFLSPLQCSDVAIDHVMGQADLRKGTRGAARISFVARHGEPGWFGESTAKEVSVMSIWHAEFSGHLIRRLFVLIDEVAIWRQILSS